MAFVTWGGNYCIAQETAYKTLSFPDDNKNNNNAGAYTETWTAKIGNFSWEITNFNNNSWNNNWTYIKAGRQKVASVAKIDNTTPFDKAIGKIVVEVKDDVDAGLVNSICLQVASDAGFSNVIETVELKSYKMTDFVFNVSAPQANLYYRLKFDLKKGDKKKNGFLQVNKVEYYEDVSNKTATSLSFDAPSYTISKDQTLTKLPTLKADEKPLFGKNITWSSDNENVATVDANGTVTGVAAGNAKITAKFAGDDTYKTSTASYEIIVKGAPSLSFPEKSYTVEMGDIFTAPKLEGLPEDVTPAYTSSNKEVATVDAATGEVTIVGVGTTTITVTSPETGIYEGATASYELTVKLATTRKVTFDFSTFGYDNGQEVTEVKLGGITMTFDANGKTNSPTWYKTGTAVRLYAGNILTISSVSRIKSVEFICSPDKETEKIKYITSENTKLSAGVYNNKNNTWDLSGANEKVVTLKNALSSSGHFRIQRIIVTTELPTSVGTISIATPEGFGTYYNSNSYILPEGLTAFGYKEANTDGTLVKTDEFTGGDVVPAGAALVVKGNTGDYECYATDQAATKTLEGNLLKGVAAQTEITVESGIKRYVLTKVNGVLGFYQTQSGNIKVPANRAYLELKEAQAQAVSFFQLDGETTGIENATATTKEAPKAIYTLSGVRLKATTTQGLPAGAYVVNGKVVIVK